MINAVRTIHLVGTQNFPKTDIPDPLTCTRTYAYQEVRYFSFSENFAYVLNEWCLMWEIIKKAQQQQEQQQQQQKTNKKDK